MCLKNLVGTVAAIISAVLSILVVLLALLYLLVAVNIAGESVKNQKELCDLLQKYPLLQSDVGNNWCANWKLETAAGILGLLFGLLQAAVSIGMLGSKREMWRTWLAVQIFALVPMLAITGMVFKIYRDYDEKNSFQTVLQYLAQRGISGFKAGFNHNGAPSDAKTGNGIVLTYGFLALVNALYIIVSAVVILCCEVLI